MTLLTVLEFPDPRLRTRAAPVSQFDAALARLIEDMFETMYAAPGIGLAATQVDVHRQLIVMDVGKEAREPQVFINPQILASEGSIVMEEGCLSVPGVYDDVQRFERVRVRALDRKGISYERELDGLTGVCLQHEMDHLNGRLFVDYLSEMKRQRIRKKLEKERRERMVESADAQRPRAPAS